MAPQKNSSQARDFDITIVGGLGHVGLPLGLVLADKGFKVCLYDLNTASEAKLAKGEMPFIEYDAEPILKRVYQKTLFVSSSPEVIARSQTIIVAIGTPVDEYMNPMTLQFLRVFRDLKPHLDSGKTLIIRSTVYPRTCEQIARELGSEGGPWNIAYCPERIAQGYAVRELAELPQIISGMTEKAINDSKAIFSKVTEKLIVLDLAQAELVKLFSNAWRYIQFAVANQFYMISTEFGVDFNTVRKAMVEGYGRSANLPTAGFAAGPCLLKDTMQISAFNGNRFVLGQSAMAVNEGLPHFIVERLAQVHDLSKMRVGILGMSFKANIDDIRDSLSYKLGKILRFKGATVYYSDEFAKDSTFISKEEMFKRAQIVIVGVPHSAYSEVTVPPNVEVVDLWGILKSPAHSVK